MADDCEGSGCVNDATEYEDFNGTSTQLCETCYEELPIDGYTGVRVSEIVASIETPSGTSVDVGQETYDNEVITCVEDGATEMFRNDAINVFDNSCGEFIPVRFSLEIETCMCPDCDNRHWTTEMSRAGNGSRYCSECITNFPTQSDDDWDFTEENSMTGERYFEWLSDRNGTLSTDKYPVSNGVGIEFEVEEGSSLEYTTISENIAQAKEDPSLNYGTEYVSYVLQGDDISDTVRGMCEQFSAKGFKMSRRAGWHFHYSMKDLTVRQQKKVWKALERFSDVILSDHSTTDYSYFTSMTRDYARRWSDRYKIYASTWSKGAGSTRYNKFRNWVELDRYGSQGHTENTQKYSFVNWRPMQNASHKDHERIEVRLYSPHVFRREVTNELSWTGRAYNLLANDYLSFIRFWDEFVNLSKRKRIKFTDSELNTLPMRKFASQFSQNTHNWLVENSDYMNRREEE